MDVSQLVMQILTMLIPTLGGSLIGSLIGSYKSRSSKEKALYDYTRLSMKRDLRELHKRICIEQQVATIDDREDAEDIYKAYQALGGNGTCTTLYNEIMQRPITS